MIRGWFIGNFSPSVLRTDKFEAAIQRYKAGDIEHAHIHKIAIELTVIVAGVAKMNGILYQEGDIVIINPGEAADFIAMTDVITAVVKIPSIPNDKFHVNQVEGD